MNGQELIDIICQRLRDKGNLLTDSNIIMLLRQISKQELNQALSFGDVTKWHNERVVKEHEDNDFQL